MANELEKVRARRQQIPKLYGQVNPITDVEGTAARFDKDYQMDLSQPRQYGSAQLQQREGLPQITQSFGQKSKYDVFSGGVNYGVDFGVRTGTPVGLPPGQWDVMEAYDDAVGQGRIGDRTNKGYGNSVLVRNAQTGESLRLSHLDNIGVRQGQRIPGGTVIGSSGGTGNVTAPHLDVEYRNSRGQLSDVLRTPHSQYLVGKGGGDSLGKGGGFSDAMGSFADAFSKNPKAVGEALGGGIKNLWNLNQMNTDDETDRSMAEYWSRQAQKSAQEGDKQGMFDALAKSREYITRNQQGYQDIADSSVENAKKGAAGGVGTGLQLLGAGKMTPTLGAIGTGLGTGIAAATGRNVPKAFGRSLGMLPQYAGVNALTAPAISSVMSKVSPLDLTARFLAGGTTNAVANVAEDELMARGIDRRTPTWGERATSGAIGFGMGAAGQIAPTLKLRSQASEAELAASKLNSQRGGVQLGAAPNLLSEAKNYKNVDAFIKSQNIDSNKIELYNKIYGETGNKIELSKSGKTPQGEGLDQANLRGKAGNQSQVATGNQVSGINTPKLASAINANPDGFTVKLDGKPVSSGYVVSPYKGRELKVKNVDEKILSKFIDDNLDVLKNENNYIGGWRNSEDGMFYLDVSVVKENVDNAIKVAVENEQIAIFNLNNGKEITTNDFLKGKLTDIFNQAGSTNSYLREGQPEIGKEYNTGDTVARERFDIEKLKKINFGGSDRDVYDLGDGQVIKVAKTARGLAQNDLEGEPYAPVPKSLEKGSNYVVVEKVNPPNAVTKKMVKDLDVEFNKAFGENNNGHLAITDAISRVSAKYVDGSDENLQEVGNLLQDLNNYDIMSGDITSIRNWGTDADGMPSLVDAGSLQRSVISDYRGKTNLADPEFNKVYQQSRTAKKKFGDTDSKTMYGFVPALGAGAGSLFNKRADNNTL